MVFIFKVYNTCSTKVMPSVPERQSSLEVVAEEEMEQDPEDNLDFDILDIDLENLDINDID